MLRSLLSLFVVFLVSLAVPASALEAPKGPTILTVTGAIGVGNADGAAQFDRALLEGLDWQEIETFTSFTDGPQRFAGPTLASLLDKLGVSSGVLWVTAINDYSVSLPVADAWAHNVILAMDHNGKPMRVRDKGPIWVVYPLTEEEAALKPFDSEMIWQLVRIDVRE